MPDIYHTNASIPPTDAQVATLLTEYVQAWETADVPRLVALLRDDAVLSMPPLPVWYEGQPAIQAFLRAHLFAGDAALRFRLIPTGANGCPAFAVYTRDAGGIYRPGALQVLSIVGDRIAAMHDFLALNDRLFAQFTLAPTA